MQIDSSIFKAYDIRGEISAHFAWAVTAAFPARNSQRRSLKALPTWVLTSNQSA